MCVCAPSHSVASSSFATPWAVAHPLSMGFFRQKHWRGLPFSGDLLPPGIEPTSPALQEVLHLCATGEARIFSSSLWAMVAQALLLTHPCICEVAATMPRVPVCVCVGGLRCCGPQPRHRPPAAGEGKHLCPPSWGPPQPPESVTTLLGSRDTLPAQLPCRQDAPDHDSAM